MPDLKDSEIPAFVRRCWDAHQKANIHIREAETERLRFYVGGDLQWRPDEIEKRKHGQRPWVTINRCKPAVDNVEGDIRMNPPGPQCHPVGGGADPDTADIMEGLIREVEYRSGAKTAYSTAGKYSAATGYAVLELATEYVNDRSFAQQLVIKSVEDPAMVFFDPSARMANRQDAMWAGKLKMYATPEDYIGAFGKNHKVLDPNGIRGAAGWIQDAMGISGDANQIVNWTGNGKGPFYVCEFYRVEVEPIKLRVCTDHVARFDDEELPRGVKRLEDKEYIRAVGRRKVCKYVVDALEVHEKTDWYGRLIPLIPVLGPEIYIEGKLSRLSLISGALDSQRGLNYIATTMTEMGGMMPKSPWIGPEGTFDDDRWLTASTEVWAYLEYKPVYAVDEGSGQKQLMPPPQRNNWEAPIQWLLQLAAYFADAIKATTSIYDPSLGVQKGDISGRALSQLRSESSVANFSYSDNLHRAIEVMYNEMVYIFPQIMDGPRVVTTVKPDSQHEVVQINREFPGGIDPATNRAGKAHNIGLGNYSVRVIAGPSFETRQDEAAELITEFLTKDPQAMAVPGVAGRLLRMIGHGNPQIEAMADLLSPGMGGDVTPEQMAQQVSQLKQQNQAQMGLIQKMQQALLAKLPEIEARKWIAMVNAIAGIREAEIKAGVDKAQQDLDAFEHLTSLAHDVGTQGMDQVHEHNLQQAQLDATAQQQQSAASQPQPTGANQ